MNNTINLTINEVTFNNVPMEMAKAIQLMLNPYKAKDETPKAKAETPKAKTEPKAKVKVYTKTEDGKGVLVGTNGFIPTKVFKGVTYSLKQSGAKYNADTKAWMFETKTKCNAWCKAQDTRA